MVLKRVFIVFWLLVFSGVFAMARLSFSRHYENGAVDLVMAGKAHKPFQFRVLIPLLVRGTVESLSEEPKRFLGPVLWLYETIGVFALFVAYWYFLSLFFPEPRWQAIGLGTLVVGMVPNYLFTYWYPWDMYSLCFLTLGLTFLKERRLRAFYLLFPVAVLNRETILFPTVFFVLWLAHTEGWNIAWRHGVAQAGIWLFLKGFLSWYFQDNPGEGAMETHWRQNLAALLVPAHIPFWLGNMGGMWIPVVLLARRIREDFLRGSLIIPVVMLPVILYGGSVVELRVYGEFLPMVCACFTSLLRAKWGDHVAETGRETADSLS